MRWDVPRESAPGNTWHVASLQRCRRLLASTPVRRYAASHPSASILADLNGLLPTNYEVRVAVTTTLQAHADATPQHPRLLCARMHIDFTIRADIRPPSICAAIDARIDPLALRHGLHRVISTDSALTGSRTAPPCIPAPSALTRRKANDQKRPRHRCLCCPIDVLPLNDGAVYESGRPPVRRLNSLRRSLAPIATLRGYEIIVRPVPTAVSNGFEASTRHVPSSEGAAVHSRGRRCLRGGRPSNQRRPGHLRLEPHAPPASDIPHSRWRRAREPAVYEDHSGAAATETPPRPAARLCRRTWIVQQRGDDSGLTYALPTTLSPPLHFSPSFDRRPRPSVVSLMCTTPRVSFATRVLEPCTSKC